jgi:formylglycine-generating enzyme required for sulfatase activity
MMPRIFISYRRQDSSDVTGRIDDRLAAQFGRDHVFKDLVSIPPGVEFRKHLYAAITACDVALVVIGREWLEARDAAGNRRLDDDADFVRVEIEAALQRNIALIPLLIDKAPMPRKDQLPLTLQGLVFRNGMQIRSDGNFHGDMDELVRALKQMEPPREVLNSVGMKLVRISAGEFSMGSPHSDEDAFDWEKPQHPVCITTPFYLGIFPVTQEQYEPVMGKNPSRFHDDSQRPVECVSWFDAVDFCRRLSEREGKEYRLPTEAEWEYACRGGTTTRYYRGDSASERMMDGYCWYASNSDGITRPVGKKLPNAWGLYDMSGNVWEWCQDWYAGDYYKISPTEDPPGPQSGSERVRRGGSFRAKAASCRSARRNNRAPGGRGENIGFRVALSSAGIGERSAT